MAKPSTSAYDDVIPVDLKENCREKSIVRKEMQLDCDDTD